MLPINNETPVVLVPNSDLVVNTQDEVPFGGKAQEKIISALEKIDLVVNAPEAEVGVVFVVKKRTMLLAVDSDEANSVKDLVVVVLDHKQHVVESLVAVVDCQTKSVLVHFSEVLETVDLQDGSKPPVLLDLHCCDPDCADLPSNVVNAIEEVTVVLVGRVDY